MDQVKTLRERILNAKAVLAAITLSGAVSLVLACSAFGADAIPTASPGSTAAHEATPSSLSNEKVRVSVNLDLGGAITFLAPTGSDANLINSFDWGRQAQMSFYSGPIPFTPGGKSPHKAWEKLGWNPIQSGDSYGHRSRVVEHHNDGHEIYVKTVPMQWPLADEPGECEFESWITLDGPAVRVHNRLNNHRSDHTQYSARTQELPAVYTNGPWHVLKSYTGDKPFAGEPLSILPSVFMWKDAEPTENWIALLDDTDHGVGVWNPGVYQAGCGYAGKVDLRGGTKDFSTGYIAPNRREILDHNIVYDFEYSLIVGSVEEIRRYVYDHAVKPGPPTYYFKKDRQHWYYEGTTDAGWPIEGALNVSLEKSGAHLIGPEALWKAADGPTLRMVAACRLASGNVGNCRVFWRCFGDAKFTSANSLSFTLVADGEFHTIEVPLASSPQYHDTITQLRIDPPPSDGRPGQSIQIREISLNSKPLP